MEAVVAQLVAERKSFSVKERTHAANETGKKYPLSATDHLLCQMAVDEAGTNGIGHKPETRGGASTNHRMPTVGRNARAGRARWRCARF